MHGSPAYIAGQFGAVVGTVGDDLCRSIAVIVLNVGSKDACANSKHAIGLVFRRHAQVAQLWHVKRLHTPE